MVATLIDFACWLRNPFASEIISAYWWLLEVNICLYTSIGARLTHIPNNLNIKANYFPGAVIIVKKWLWILINNRDSNKIHTLTYRHTIMHTSTSTESSYMYIYTHVLMKTYIYIYIHDYEDIYWQNINYKQAAHL